MSHTITKEDIESINIDEITEKVIFHGGCDGCTQQELNGIRFCKGCQFFAPDWNLPDLNNSPPDYGDVVREAMHAEDNFLQNCTSSSSGAQNERMFSTTHLRGVYGNDVGTCGTARTKEMHEIGKR